MADSKSESRTKPKKSTGGDKQVEVLAMVKEEICTSVVPSQITPKKDARCVMDSGATVSLFHSISAFVPGTLVATSPRRIALADKRSMTATMHGDVVIPFDNVKLTITNCLYAPQLGHNLVSIGPRRQGHSFYL